MRTPLIVATVVLLAAPGWAQRRDRSGQGFDFGPRSPEPGEMCHDVELLGIDGERMRLSDERGKYVVFEFVHPQDETVAAKVPSMNALRAKYAKNGQIEFLTVVGTGEYERNGRVERADRTAERERIDERKWVEFLRSHQGTFTDTRLVTDADPAIARTVYGGFINQTYLIGPDGRVIERWSWCDPGALETTIDRELGTGDAARAVSFTGPIRPTLPLAERVRASRRRVQALPVAQELVRNGSAKFLADRDKDGSGDLIQGEAGFAKELFNRVDRDGNGLLTLEEIQLAEEAAAQRLP